MTPREFFDLTASVRKAQKDYFAARKRQAPKEECDYLLNISRTLERQIDAEIERVQKLQKEPELNFG